LISYDPYKREWENGISKLIEIAEECKKDVAKIDNERNEAITSQIIEKLNSLSLPKQFEEYIDKTRITELESANNTIFDLRVLIALSKEVNIAYANNCFLTIPMILRTIINHVPPIFNCQNFSEVANNYSGGKSFKASMKTLNDSLKNIADSFLHTQVRNSEVLPTKVQVDFRQNMDTLLSEIVRILK
jgi:hypothetical protein